MAEPFRIKPQIACLVLGYIQVAKGQRFTEAPIIIAGKQLDRCLEKKLRNKNVTRHPS